MLIDTHAHLYDSVYLEDWDEMLTRAEQNGVKHILLPNIDLESIAPLEELCAKSTMCLPMMGLHPSSVNSNWKTDLDTVVAVFEKHPSRYIGIGEIGMDLYWDTQFKGEQECAFREQLKLAKSFQKPISIHVRNAFDEVLKIVEEENNESLRGVFHCFTGSLDQANRILEFGGFALGIGGVVTFKNAEIAKTLGHVDLKHIVLETDAPYLSPSPYRGKRNESSYLRFIAEKLAEIYNVDYQQICEITSQNAEVIFKISEFIKHA